MFPNPGRGGERNPVGKPVGTARQNASSPTQFISYVMLVLAWLARQRVFARDHEHF